MRKITESKEILRTFQHFLDLYSIAANSLCLRSKCGAKIVNNFDGNHIDLGAGFNSPPGNKKLEKCLKDELPEDFKSDKTCCVHAEQRAIKNAINNYGEKMLDGSTIYFARLDLNDKLLYAGKPYCTICSKEALDAGIKNWVLLHKEGFYSYDADEYNEISFGRLGWKL